MINYRNAESTIKRMYAPNRNLYFMCLLVGVLTGFTVSLYRLCLEEISEFRKIYFQNVNLNNPLLMLKILLIFIAVGIIIDLLLKKFPRTSGSGIPQVKGLILGRIDYKNWFGEIVGKFLGGVLGIGSGLSLGREGPSVQLGSYIGYGVSKFFKSDIVDRNYLLTSGSSAGLAGAFGAPLAGVMFSIEEIHKYISGKLLICTFIASIASDFVGRRIFGVQTAFAITVNFPLEVSPYFQFALYVFFGIIISFFGKLFTFSLIKAQDIFKKIKIVRYLKITFVMTISFILCFILPEVTGGGHELVESLIDIKLGISFLIIIFVFKLIFTTISYSTGFAGGIFLPMLVLGALIGEIYGRITVNIFNITPEIITHFIVLGMAAYFVSVVRAPITGIILILEMTGSFHLLLALAIVSIVSFYITDLLHLEPIYDILYDRMEKDDDTFEEENHNKTIIRIPIMAESLIDGKSVSEIIWPEEVLVVSIIRNGIEKIPKGRTVMMAGDILVLLLPENKVSEVKEKMVKATMKE